MKATQVNAYAYTHARPFTRGRTHARTTGMSCVRLCPYTHAVTYAQCLYARTHTRAYERTDTRTRIHAYVHARTIHVMFICAHSVKQAACNSGDAGTPLSSISGGELLPPSAQLRGSADPSCLFKGVGQRSLGGKTLFCMGPVTVGEIHQLSHERFLAVFFLTPFNPLRGWMFNTVCHLFGCCLIS